MGRKGGAGWKGGGGGGGWGDYKASGSLAHPIG